jgi:transcriptional regulator with XRE-family HTH domain
MSERFKSKDEILRLASILKKQRLLLGLTLKDVEKLQNINCGQLSRLEAGHFKTNSKNLRKLCKFLQINYQSILSCESALGLRLEQFAARSAQHQAAAEEILCALERLN